MQVFASISPWLPLLSDYLSTIVVLEEKAAELYRLSLLEKPTGSIKSRETVLGVWKGGQSLKTLHDHLIRSGFQRRSILGADAADYPGYYREDLGNVRFLCPQIRPHQRPSGLGLTAIPEKRTALLLENPHFVDVSYLGKNYEVLIPQVGRFILDKGLKLKLGRNLNTEKVYESSQNLLMIIDLLVSHDEMQEEALNDLLEIRPPSLVKEFIQLLKHNGPGSVLWDSAQRFYLEKYPDLKIVSLTKWYWEFLPLVTKSLEKQKSNLN